MIAKETWIEVLVLVVLVTIFTTCPPAYGDSLIQNGSFEVPACGGPGACYVQASNWNGGPIPVIIPSESPGWPPPQDGQQYYELGAGGYFVIQVFDIPQAGSYTLSWYEAAIFDSSLQVTIDLATVSQTNLPGNSTWINRTVTVALSAGPHVLRFLDTDGFNAVLIDNVRLEEGANLPPVADAGPDQTVSPGVVVTLDGTHSSGSILAYHWKQAGSDPVGVILQNADTATASFLAPELQDDPAQFIILNFDLMVSDGTLSDTARVRVFVVPSPCRTEVARLPQCKGNWGQLLYAHHTPANGTTICGVGCMLSSVAMVFNYAVSHSNTETLNPGELNDFAKDNHGYTNPNDPPGPPVQTDDSLYNDVWQGNLIPALGKLVLADKMWSWIPLYGSWFDFPKEAGNALQGYLCAGVPVIVGVKPKLQVCDEKAVADKKNSGCQTKDDVIGPIWGHFVVVSGVSYAVVDGQLRRHFEVKDPAGMNAETLDAYNFLHLWRWDAVAKHWGRWDPVKKQWIPDLTVEYPVGADGISVFTLNGLIKDPENLGSVTIVTDDEVDLLLTDPSGKRVGWDPTVNQRVRELPESAYLLEAIVNDTTDEVPTRGIAKIEVNNPAAGDYQLVIRPRTEGNHLVQLYVTSADGSVQPRAVVEVGGEGDSMFFALVRLVAQSGGQSSIVLDTMAPVTQASVEPMANVNGWHNTDVLVLLSAVDNPGGAGAKEIWYTLVGAQTGSGVVTGSTAAVNVSAEGVTTLTYFGMDNAGNQEAAKTLTVRIDKSPPTVTCRVTPNVLWPPNNKLVTVTAAVTATDTGSGPAGFILTSVMSNEPTGFGDIVGFVVGTLDTVGQLRASRLGTGTGRVYTLTYQGIDVAGNLASCSTTLTVPHDQGH